MGVIDPVALSSQLPPTVSGADTASQRAAFRPVVPIEGLTPAQSSDKETAAPSFKDMLVDAIDAVNDLQINADKMTQKLATGEVKDIHDVLIAVEQVNIGLQLTMQIRNKVVEAYQEIMRMQI